MNVAKSIGSFLPDEAHFSFVLGMLWAYYAKEAWYDINSKSVKYRCNTTSGYTLFEIPHAHYYNPPP